MTVTTHPDSIVIRRAHDTDADALERLAALDGVHLPHGDLLVAEVDGVVRAAMRIEDRAFVADPFAYTRDVVELLDARVGMLRREQFGLRARAWKRLALWSDLWARAAQTRPSQ